MAGPQIGDIAPDFTLPGVPPGEYRLGAQLGKRVVLAFYPGDFTPVCTKQLSAYSAGYEALSAKGAVLWGISVDDLEMHERFAKSRALGFPLLSDATGNISRLYGVLGILGTSRRTIFIIDEQGKVTWRKSEILSLTYAGLDDIIELLG